MLPLILARDSCDNFFFHEAPFIYFKKEVFCSGIVFPMLQTCCRATYMPKQVGLGSVRHLRQRPGLTWVLQPQ